MAPVPLQIVNNSIVVEATVNGKTVSFVVDTGDAIGPTFNATDAKTLDLPNLGPLEVSGAGGDVQISRTEADISLGGNLYAKEPGAIDPNLEGSSLLGLPFFLRQGGILSFDFDYKELSIDHPMPLTGIWNRVFTLFHKS